MVSGKNPSQRVDFKAIQWRNDYIMSPGKNGEFTQFQKMKKPSVALHELVEEIEQ